MEDGTILDLYFARDEAAVAQTAEKYGGKLRGLAGKILSDHSHVEECENDTYLAAWNAIPPQRPRYFFAWLAKVIRRLALDRVRHEGADRRSAVIVELTAEMEACIPAREVPESGMIAELIGAYLKTLSNDTRYIFVRRYWYMDSVAELAADLGVGESKVKSSLFRARKGLKAYLEKEGFRP